MNFIKDKNGQWAHPGKNTLIPDTDGRITMKGVNYPVLGIDDEGNQQVMMPGGEYKFPGNDVYEIPLPEYQPGGPLTKLDKGKKLVTPITNWAKETFPSIFGNVPYQSSQFTSNLKRPLDFQYRPKTFAEWDWYINRYNIENKPGLYIGSLAPDNSLLRNTDKTGNVHLGTIQRYVDKANNNADKAVMQNAVDQIKNSIGPSQNPEKVKIPYALFEQQVQNGLINFTPELTQKYAGVGLNELRYADGTALSMQQIAGATGPGVNQKPINAQTILWKNTNVPNQEGISHFEGTPGVYGHTRYYANPKLPSLFTILEIQSDEFQRPILNKIKKNQESLAKIEEKLKLHEDGAFKFEVNKASIYGDAQQERDFIQKLREDKKQLEHSKQILTDAINNSYKTLDARTDLQNSQIKNLEKNHSNRLFSETINYASDNNFKTVRFPHQSTIATIEGFSSGQLSLEQRLENPWTEMNVAEFDQNLKRLTNEATYGHTKIAKKYGPFVYIPNSSHFVHGTVHNKAADMNVMLRTNPDYSVSTNSVIRLDSNGDMVYTNGKPQSVKHLKPNVTKYMNDENYRSEMQKLGWTDDDIVDFQNNIGHWKNNFIANKQDGTGQELMVREINYNSGYRNTTTRNGWDHKQNHIDLPPEIEKNLNPGYYHIQDDGTWKFISGTSEGIKKIDDNAANEKIFLDYAHDIRDINHKVKEVDLREFDINNYEKRLQTILKKYSEKDFRKMLDSTFGKDKVQYKLILDDQGNKWYEFDIPGSYKKQIKAFALGGELKDYLKKYNLGGDVDYSDTEEVQINGKTYYKYKIKKGDSKTSISTKYGLWNIEGIINSVNSNYSDIEGQPNYAKNINRMWAGDEILVGGPEFEPHVKYNEDRNKYINSFKNLSEKELWSTITAIGHIETGSLVKYKKPEGRVYITGKDLDESGNTIPGGQYDLDNHPFLGEYESGMDKAYMHVSDANALGRFGIKEVHLNKYAKEVLGYKDEQNWKQQYLKNKDDQRKLMKYLITDVYPEELVQIRHSNPKASSQYSDLELIAALHRGGQGEVKDQLKDGSLSNAPVTGDISVGGYTDKINRYLDPNLDVSNSPFFMKNQPLHKPFDNIPTYKFGGSINVKDEVIKDMLNNGAFLPKFKMGSEKKIEGIFGKYNIKKGYDDNVQLPFIEYKVPTEEIKNNKIYFDKEDIIDLDRQQEEQDRYLERMKHVVEKFNQGESLTFAEKKEMERLGLLDSKPKVQVNPQEKIGPMMYGGASMPLNQINVSKDLFNKTDGNNYGLSLASQILLYEARINGTFDKDKKFNKIKTIYNKLNRIYYNDAKASKMTVLDYMKSLNN